MRPAALALLALLPLGACKSQPPANTRVPPPLDDKYPGDAAGLKRLWGEILVAAQKDDRERVHTLMASFILGPEELVTLFGEEQGRRLEPRYAPMIAHVANIGAMELVAQVLERKYDDVEVFPVDGTARDQDRALLAALKTKLPVYGARVKRKEQALGLRYDHFMFLGGRWGSTNQLAERYLVTRDGGDGSPGLAPSGLMGSRSPEGGGAAVKGRDGGR